MSEPTRAVFLSYASQDAGAARRISDLLTAAGIEVWFDQSELRGGDTWDQKIRHQIRDCALFLPIISANTHARTEGYFRLEWKLAVDRSHLMAPDRPFLLPVVIDGTSNNDSRIPDRFREIQWTHLPNGDAPSVFVERVRGLLCDEDALGATLAGADPIKVSRGVTAPPHARPTRSNVLIAIAAGAVVLAGIGVLYRQSHGAVDVTQEPASASMVSGKSIAVLPFVDMSEKRDQEYFSDGLTEELLDLLAQVPDLHVPARTSSFYFKGKQVTIAEIAKALGVANVLEGSVRKAGNTVRVTAQLIRADNGYHLWSKTYDRDMKDIFKVQDEIAATVVNALKASLLPTVAAAARRRTANTDAYNQYLLARSFYFQFTVPGYRRAVAAYKTAISLDPNYAAAYAGLAIAENELADKISDPAGIDRAAAAAERAIKLGPDIAAGYAARGYLRAFWLWNWVGAMEDFNKALALDPNNSLALAQYSFLLAAEGRLPEAINVAQRSIKVDPLVAIAWVTLARHLNNSGDLRGARSALHRAHELDPDLHYVHFELAVTELLAGQPAQAMVSARADGEATWRLAGVAAAAHSLQHPQESQQALDELISTQAKNAAYQIAEVYAWRGDQDQAFEWLDRAYAQRDGGLIYLRTDALLASLRGDQRYPALLRKMHLPE